MITYEVHLETIGHLHEANVRIGQLEKERDYWHGLHTSLMVELKEIVAAPAPHWTLGATRGVGTRVTEPDRESRDVTGAEVEA